MEKLTFKDVQEGVLQLGCGVVFEYNGKPCGVQTEVENCVFSFTMWYGEWWADYSDFQVMTQSAPQSHNCLKVRAVVAHLIDGRHIPTRSEEGG